MNGTFYAKVKKLKEMKVAYANIFDEASDCLLRGLSTDIFDLQADIKVHYIKEWKEKSEDINI